MTTHAFLPPSGAAKWVQCALWPTMVQRYPEREANPLALEGEAAHWVTQMQLQGTPVAIDTQAPNGTAVTLEMLEGAQLVQDDVRAQLGADWQSRLFVEHPLQIPRIHAQNYGTPDYRAWGRLPDGRLKLWLWDYKFGYRLVEAFENWQLIDYVAGALSEAQIDGLQEQNVVVDMRIVQPRSYHAQGSVRNWTVKASDLRTYWNRLEMAAEDATSIIPTASPHMDVCEECPGRHACQAVQRVAYIAGDRGQMGVIHDMPPEAMGQELRALKRAQALLDARVTGLEAEVTALKKAGKSVPLWALESTPGRLAWTKGNAEVLAVGQMFGLDLAKPVEPITPTQAKAAAKAAKLPESLIDAYANRSAGGSKLVYDDGSKARLTFSSSVA